MQRLIGRCTILRRTKRQTGRYTILRWTKRQTGRHTILQQTKRQTGRCTTLWQTKRLKYAPFCCRQRDRQEDIHFVVDKETERETYHFMHQPLWRWIGTLVFCQDAQALAQTHQRLHKQQHASTRPSTTTEYPSVHELCLISREKTQLSDK